MNKGLKEIQNNEDLCNLRFCLTGEMDNLFVDIVMSKQQLEREDLSLKEQIALKRHIDKMTKKYIEEFRKNNVEQIKKYNELINR